MMKRLVLICLFAVPLLADDWSGVDYAGNSAVQQSHAEYLIRSVSFSGNEEILDIGCGDGRRTALMAQLVP